MKTLSNKNAYLYNPKIVRKPIQKFIKSRTRSEDKFKSAIFLFIYLLKGYSF